MASLIDTSQQEELHTSAGATLPPSGDSITSQCVHIGAAAESSLRVIHQRAEFRDGCEYDDITAGQVTRRGTSEHHHFSLFGFDFLHRHVHLLVVSTHVVGQPTHSHGVTWKTMVREKTATSRRAAFHLAEPPLGSAACFSLIRFHLNSAEI